MSDHYEATTQRSLRALDALKAILSGVDRAQCDTLEEHIFRANRVFVTGSGRSMLMMRGFAMRLMQLGITAYVAGDSCTPSIGAGDLLIAGTASGRTPIVLTHLKKAREMGAATAMFTINATSPASELADAIVCIPASSAKAGSAKAIDSPHITGSSFEEALLVLTDAMVMTYAMRYSVDCSDAAIMRRHANLE